MPLSDQEIKVLLEKADKYASCPEWHLLLFPSLLHLEQSLKCCNKIIDNVATHSHYYIKRAKVKYALAHESVFYNLDSAIEDINKAIEMEPDKGEYYLLRGTYLSLKRTEGKCDAIAGLERIAGDYKASRERDPGNPEVWLNLIEINILMQNYDKAISIYGECEPFMDTKEDRLFRSWLGCLALAMAGDTFDEKDIKPFEEKSVNLSTLEEEDDVAFTALKIQFQTRFVPNVLKINDFLSTLRRENADREKLNNVRELQKLLRKSFNWDYGIDSIAKDRWTSTVFYGYTYNASIALKPLDDREFIDEFMKNYTDEKLLSKMIDKISQLKPDAETWYKKGILLQRFGDMDKRERQNIKDYPTVYKLTWLGDRASKSNKYLYIGAIEAYDKVIDARAGNAALTAAAWHNKGVILGECMPYENDEEYKVYRKEALKAYENAITLSTDDVSLAAVAWYNKGGVLRDLKRYEEALEAYDKAIEQNSDFCEAWYEKGEVLWLEFKHNDEALNAWGKSITIRPYYVVCREFFTRACHRMGNELSKNANGNEEVLEVIEKLYWWENRLVRES